MAKDLVIDIKAQNADLKKKLAESKRELNEFKRAVKDANSSAGSSKGASVFNDLLSSIGLKAGNTNGALGLLSSGLGKVAGAFGLALGAGEMFNKMVESSNSLGDEMERVQTQAGAAVNYFATSLANVDFHNFWTGLQNAITGGGQLADILDRINTGLQQLGVKTAKFDLDIASKELELAKLPRGSKERIKLEQEILELRKEQGKEFKKQAEENYKAARAMVKTATGFNDQQMEQYKDAIGAYIKGGGKYDEIGEAWKTLQRGKGANSVPTGVAGSKTYVDPKQASKQKEALKTINEYAKKTGKSYQAAMNDAHMFYKLNEVSDNKQESYGTRIRKLVETGYQLETRDLQQQSAIQQRITMEKQRASKLGAKAAKEQEALAKKTYKANAQTIFEMKANVTYLEEKRDKTLPSSEEFTKITKEIQYWKKEIEAIEFDDNTIAGLQAQLKSVNDELARTKRGTEAFTTLKNVAKSLQRDLDDLSMDEYVLNPKTTKEIEGNIARLKKRMEDLEPNTDQWRNYSQEVEELQKMLNVKPAAGSIADLQQQIEEKQKVLQVAPLTLSARIKILDEVADLQRQLDNKANGVTISVPTYNRSTTGNNKAANYEAASSSAATITQDYEIGVIGYDTAKAELQAINAELTKLGLEPLEIKIQSKGAKKTQKALEGIGDTLASVGDAFSSLGAVAEDPALDVAGIIAGAVANIMLGYAQASAQASSLTPFGWIAFVAAGLATAMAAVAQIKSATQFAEGGIVGGNSYHGDNLYARVNSGEMILNHRQQTALFNALDSGNVGGAGGEVGFILRGADLYGSLKNYAAIKAKSGHIIKIG